MLYLSALLGAAAVFFVFLSLSFAIARKEATPLEVSAALRDKQLYGGRVSLRQRFDDQLARYGFRDAVVPAVFVGLLIYTIGASIMVAFGVERLSAVIFAAPLTIGGAWIVLIRIAGQRARAFDKQLLASLRQMRSLIRGGYGNEAALERVAEAQNDPFRSEIHDLLARTRTGVPIVDGLQGVARRYPSRGMTLLVSAFQIHEDTGASIERVLERAATSMQQDAEIVDEARAALSQSKGEAWAMTLAVGWTSFAFLFSGDGAGRDALANPIGGPILIAAVANYFFGIYRAQRTFTKEVEDL